MSDSDSADLHPPTGSMTTAELLRYKDRLTALKSSLESAVAASEQKVTDEEREDIDTRILELQEELLKESSVKAAQSLALQRLQMGGALLDVLFDETASISGEERGHIEAQLGRQRDLTTEILAHGDHCKELRHQQDQLQAERRDLTKQNRILMAELKDLQAMLTAVREDNGDTTELRENVEKKRGHLSIIQNVLQGLIIGSGVNWAKDPQLTQLLLSLGEKIP